MLAIKIIEKSNFSFKFVSYAIDTILIGISYSHGKNIIVATNKFTHHQKSLIWVKKNYHIFTIISQAAIYIIIVSSNKTLYVLRRIRVYNFYYIITQK